MSVSSLLFVNRPIPGQLTIEFDGKMAKYHLEEGHEIWWDKCFANNVTSLPRHHYRFEFPSYTQSARALRTDDEPAWYERKLESARIAQAYIVKLIDELGEEPLYIRLHADHILTEGDLEDVTEIDLSEYDFTEGNEPDAFGFEINRFYRFVRR